MDRGISKIKDWFDQEKFTFLLCSLTFYVVASPFLEGFFHRGTFLRTSFLVVLITGVYAVSSRKDHLILISVIACMSLATFCLGYFNNNETVLVVDTVIKTIFNGCLIYIIAGHSYRCEEVTRDTISAALIGYILLSLLWTNLYYLVELMYPNSFNVPHETIIEDQSILRYFSLVTMTTLGYGDIAPVSPQAKDIAVVEAFMGQVYLAVLVARLVAIQTSQALRK